MSRIKGRDFILFTYAGGSVRAIGSSTSCSLTIEQEMIETLNKSDWRWRNYVRGKRGWSMSVSGFVDVSDYDLPLMMSGEYYIGFATVASHDDIDFNDYVVDGRRQYFGLASLSACEQSGEVDGFSVYSLEFTGIGELVNAAPIRVYYADGTTPLVLPTSRLASDGNTYPTIDLSAADVTALNIEDTIIDADNTNIICVVLPTSIESGSEDFAAIEAAAHANGRIVLDWPTE